MFTVHISIKHKLTSLKAQLEELKKKESGTSSEEKSASSKEVGKKRAKKSSPASVLHPKRRLILTQAQPLTVATVLLKK